jgi:alpha-D-ribose 1-methylphosphonate 5-triphosphate synthase subunit PhnH
MTVSGFSQPVLHAQATFRAILDALSRPGTVQPITNRVAAPPPLSAGAAAVALTLSDHDTPVWLDAALCENSEVSQWLRFNCGCPIVADPREAAFAFVRNPQDLPPFDAFNLGTAEYPDRSTTIVLQVESMDAGVGLSLMGPGVRDKISLNAKPLPSDIADRLVRNRLLAPRGIDLLLVTESAVAGLPRSVRVVEN